MKKAPADQTQASIPGTINQTIAERYQFKPVACDGKKKVIAQTNGEPRTIHWPKNIGGCTLHLVSLDRAGKEIPDTGASLIDRGDEIESYTSPKGAYSIAYYCDFDGDIRPDCALEIDRR